MNWRSDDLQCVPMLGEYELPEYLGKNVTGKTK